MNLRSVRAKANANYTCQECGSTELIQAHHQIPGDDESIIVLCAECHSNKHPDLPRALFFSNNKQPYWHNKSASSLAKSFGVHSRTIIRAAKKLGILPGELTPWDEELIKNNIRKPNPKPRNPTFERTCSKCNYAWRSYKLNSYYCPRCGHWVGNNCDTNPEILRKERQPSLFSKGVFHQLKK